MTAPASDALELRRSHTLTALVAERIERLILEGRLSAGDRINEVALAKELGVSRGPVREAARQLVNSGLVQFVANKGAFVREIDEADMLELYDLRAVLTGYACGMAAARATDRDKVDIAALRDRLVEAAKSGDREAYFTLNLAFHDRLIGMAKGRRLEGIYGGLVKEAHLFRRVSLQTLTDIEQSLADHCEIVDAILVGDAARARKAGEEHVMAGKHRFMEAAHQASAGARL